ncbi:head GIN domain-containing protein [Undibacterium sp. TJN19]|uniref:head GIN domain-containing protein n=1 Tax=Undibacterium sp. TJN19 TaxID=3413055 RepID=UPI003BF11419
MKNLISRRNLLGALLVMASVPASAGLFDGWSNGNAVNGSGTIQKQDRALSNFKGVDLALPAKLELRQGDKEAVQVETDDNLQALIETVVESGVLKIRSADKKRYPATKVLNIVVYLKNLDHVAVSGSGKITTDKLATRDFQAVIGGSGDIQIKTLQADEVKVSIGGSGNFVAGGSASQLNGKIGGSGSISTGRLETKNVSIKIGGSGEAEVWAKETLDVSIGGSGDITYYGDPKVTKSIGGSGKITRKAAAPV